MDFLLEFSSEHQKLIFKILMCHLRQKIKFYIFWFSSPCLRRGDSLSGNDKNGNDLAKDLNERVK